MNLQKIQNLFRQELHQRGFHGVYFTNPPLGQAVERFREWLKRGYGGQMEYLQRRQGERSAPERLLPELRSIILAAHPYDTRLENTQDPSEGNISRYAWGEDYHQILTKKLKDFIAWLKGRVPQGNFYLSVDAQPVLEKAWAQKAGLGWMGKHTNIIDRETGSYFFISAILSDIPFTADPPQEDHCGSCEACIQVCPTGAIVAPYVLDANRCISYLTIELKGAIPRELRPMIGNRIFGCDDCQEVCPWNRFSQTTREQSFFPKEGILNQPLENWIKLTPKEFKKKFKDSAISRARWKGFMRNVLVAIGNSRNPNLAPLVEEKLKEEHPLVRGHAVWAYHRLLGKKANGALRNMREKESDGFVLEEIEEGLKGPASVLG